jgi:GNAT superfamily N-acetyltransferase
MMTRPTNAGEEVLVRPVLEGDLDQVDLIYRTAFGTFFGELEPEKIFGDTELVRTRWVADHGAGLAALLDGTLVGSNFITTWGSFGFFGPLTVKPEYWDRGIAHQLIDSTMELFNSRNTRHLGLFTFAHSPKHVVLYQHYGFWPRFLIAVMEAPVDEKRDPVSYVKFSDAAAVDRAGTTAAVRELTGTVFEGLDVSGEIDAVFDQKLGETVLIEDLAGLQAVAICHIGPGTEAGSGKCYVKFAAARPGRDAASSFAKLIAACQDLAASHGATVVQAGVNFAREQAYGALLEAGFRTQFQGLSMHRPNEDAYDTVASWVLDDWR